MGGINHVTEHGGGKNDGEDGPSAGTVVCIVEHEARIGRIALERLRHQGFTIVMLAIKAGVIQRTEQLRPALVLIEVAISRAHALELCRDIRSIRSLARTAIVLLAARASEEERLLGLESGADDFISGSYTGREVVARVQATIRRMRQLESLGEKPSNHPHFLDSLMGTIAPAVRSGDIEIDPAAMKILIRGVEISTTALEFRLLYYLLHNQGRVFTREQLLDAVWGSQFVELRSVDACVRRLRRKIEPDPLQPIYIRTIRGAGYSLRAQAA